LRKLPRLWVLVLVAILGVMAIVGWQYLRSQENQRRTEAEQALASVAILKLNEIQQWRATRIQDARLLAQNPTLLNAMRDWYLGPPLPLGSPDVRLDEVRLRMTMFLEARKFRDIRIMDADNRTIVAVHSGTAETEDATTIATLAETRKTGAPTFGELHDHGGEPMLDVAVALFAQHPDAALRASGLVLVIQIDPNTYLYPLLQRWPLPSASAETLLARRDGEDVLFISPLRHRQDPPLTFRVQLSSEKVAAAVGLRGTFGIVDGRDYRDMPILAATFRVEGTNWVMVSKVDEDEALATQRRETQMGVGILIAMSIAIVAVVMGLSEEAASAERLAGAEARAELAARDAWLGAIFRAAPIGIGLVRNRTMLEVSDGFCMLTGLAREDMLGKTSEQFYATHEEFVRAGREAQRQLRSTGAAEIETLWRDARGRLLTVFLNAAPVDPRNPDGDTTFTVTDITARKAQEQALLQRGADLERSNKELATFAYVASHDLRSPLRGIAQLAEWIAEDMPSAMPPEIDTHLKLMRSRVARMERLLDDLLSYSRVGRIEGETALVDVAQLCRESFELLAPPPEFALVLEGELPRFATRATPLTQVFQNLIGNAIKHRDRDIGKITITGRRVPGGYAFTVADDGPGIPPQFHDRIFGLFQTLRPRDEVEGSGMGLALVRKQVELYGGTVTVRSDVGHGAAFEFTWPEDAEMKGLGNDRHVA
jgi:PAS domain S-box-containing protein